MRLRASTRAGLRFISIAATARGFGDGKKDVKKVQALKILRGIKPAVSLALFSVCVAEYLSRTHMKLPILGIISNFRRSFRLRFSNSGSISLEHFNRMYKLLSLCDKNC